MTQELRIFPRLTKLRDALSGIDFSLAEVFELYELYQSLGDVTTPEGLQSAIALADSGADLLGLPPEMQAKLLTAVDDPHEFDLLLSAIRYADEEWGNGADEPGILASARAQQTVTVNMPEGAQAISAGKVIEWLPVALELIKMLREWRQRRRGDTPAA